VSTFGARLREMRLAAGLSQAGLAGDSLTASHISLLESGKRKATPQVIEQLARRLGCSASKLSEGTAGVEHLDAEPVGDGLTESGPIDGGVERPDDGDTSDDAAPDDDTFGRRLRGLRLAAGLSQTELAGDTLTASYISLLESDKRGNPTPQVVEQLAARLGCSSRQLLEGKASDREERVAVEIAFARLAIEHGQAADARGRLERLLAEGWLSTRTEDELSFLLAIACVAVGDVRAATAIFLTLFERSQSGQTHLPIGEIALHLCECYVTEGDCGRAIHSGEMALAAMRTRRLDGTNDYLRLAGAVMTACMELGDSLHAGIWADALLAGAQGLDGTAEGQATIYWAAARLAEQDGRLAESLHLAERAVRLASELDNRRDRARLLLEAADLLSLDDPPQVDRAADLLDQVREDLKGLGGAADLARLDVVSARVLLIRGDHAGAEVRARDALDSFHAAQPDARVAAYLILSDALRASGRAADAADARARATAELLAIPAKRSAALLWRELGARAEEVGEPGKALKAYRMALDRAHVRDRSRALRDQVRALMESRTFVEPQ
jgi:transcriptional regulator with XRE-family HTH domain